MWAARQSTSAASGVGQFGQSIGLGRLFGQLALGAGLYAVELGAVAGREHLGDLGPGGASSMAPVDSARRARGCPCLVMGRLGQLGPGLLPHPFGLSSGGQPPGPVPPPAGRDELGPVQLRGTTRGPRPQRRAGGLPRAGSPAAHRLEPPRPDRRCVNASSALATDPAGAMPGGHCGDQTEFNGGMAVPPPYNPAWPRQWRPPSRCHGRCALHWRVARRC